MCRKKKSKGRDITSEIFPNLGLAADSGSYVREGHEIVRRCEGFAVLTVNQKVIGTTREHVSGVEVGPPGANWTGILADVGGQRYGTGVDAEVRHKLKTCVEGKCLYELLDAKGLKPNYMKAENDVHIDIQISYEAPCDVCHAALQQWVDQYRDLCGSLTVTVKRYRYR